MNRKYLLLLCIITALIWSCKKNEAGGDTTPEPPPVVTEDVAALTAVKIEAVHNSDKISADVNCTIAGDSITAVVPALVINKKLILTFTAHTAGTIVKLNDTTQTSGVTVADLSKAGSITLATPKGNTKTYSVKIRVFTGLPILYLTTTGPVVSKDVYVTGNLVVDPNLGPEQAVIKIPLQIKGRGNSTWSNFPKKPYRMKFNSKAAMLGMPTAKNWVLLANYDDKTLMRTKIAFELARRVGSDFAPQSRFVEVVLNGDFLGNYLLTSQVEINENRVNIAELKPTHTSASDITGGYIVELDSRLDADFWFRTTTKDLPFSIKQPEEEITTAQYNYIKNYMQQTEDALYAANWNDPVDGYAKYIDPDSFMRWYIVNETVKNQDSWDFGSMFYYKDRNGKLGMGPVWDFDLSGGNVDYSVSKLSSGWYTRNGLWLIRLAQDNAWNLKWRNKWAAVRPNAIQQIFADIDNTAAYLQLSQAQNFKKWPILDQYVWPNAVVLGTYDKEVAYFKNFLTERVAWIDANISSY